MSSQKSKTGGSRSSPFWPEGWRAESDDEVPWLVLSVLWASPSCHPGGRLSFSVQDELAKPQSWEEGSSSGSSAEVFLDHHTWFLSSGSRVTEEFCFCPIFCLLFFASFC